MRPGSLMEVIKFSITSRPWPTCTAPGTDATAISAILPGAMIWRVRSGGIESEAELRDGRPGTGDGAPRACGAVIGGRGDGELRRRSARPWRSDRQQGEQ